MNSPEKGNESLKGPVGFEKLSKKLIKEAKKEIMVAAGTRMAGEPIIDGKNMVELFAEINDVIKIVRPGDPIRDPETELTPRQFVERYQLMPTIIEELMEKFGIEQTDL